MMHQIREPRGAPLSLRVLVVDDDPDLLECTAEILQTLGYEVVTAESGVHGMKTLEGSARIDFVVTDFSMPVMTGIEFIRRARKSNPGLPCLLVTGFADIGSFADAAAEKITVLRKPFKMKDLVSNIANIRETGAFTG